MQGLFNFSPDYVRAWIDGKEYDMKPYGFRWILNVFVE